MTRLWLLALLAASCAGPFIPSLPDAGGTAGSHASEALKACGAFQAQGPVDTIAAAVERLNALPEPVTPACFVASLPRPLDAVATISPISAQPAGGVDSPRVFLLMPGLVVSVVPAGRGASLLEFAEWMTPLRTLKGEVKFPLERPLAEDAPLTRVHTDLGVTSCGLCHRNETQHPTLDAGYVSDAYRPDPATLVPITRLAEYHQACSADGGTDDAGTADGGSSDAGTRCEVLHALFDFGELRQGAFSKDVALFIQ